MSCPNSVLDFDGEYVCQCGDEGLLCDACLDRQYAYWKDQWTIASPEERDPERYAQELRDAGRGHLVKP